MSATSCFDGTKDASVSIGLVCAGAGGCTLKPGAGVGFGDCQRSGKIPNGEAIGRGGRDGPDGRSIAPKPFGRSVSAIVYPSLLSSSIVSQVEGP